jgi:acyl carrier protein
MPEGAGGLKENVSMTESDVVRMVNEVFVESFEIEPGQLQPDKHVFNDLGLDSLDVVDLVVALQKKFGVKIRNDERVRNIRTLKDIYGFILAIKEETGTPETKA